MAHEIKTVPELDTAARLLVDHFDSDYGVLVLRTRILGSEDGYTDVEAGMGLANLSTHEFEACIRTLADQLAALITAKHCECQVCAERLGRMAMIERVYEARERQ